MHRIASELLSSEAQGPVSTREVTAWQDLKVLSAFFVFFGFTFQFFVPHEDVTTLHIVFAIRVGREVGFGRSIVVQILSLGHNHVTRCWPYATALLLDLCMDFLFFGISVMNTDSLFLGLWRPADYVLHAPMYTRSTHRARHVKPVIFLQCGQTYSEQALTRWVFRPPRASTWEHRHSFSRRIGPFW